MVLAIFGIIINMLACVSLTNNILHSQSTSNVLADTVLDAGRLPLLSHPFPRCGN